MRRFLPAFSCVGKKQRRCRVVVSLIGHRGIEIIRSIKVLLEGIETSSQQTTRAAASQTIVADAVCLGEATRAMAGLEAPAVRAGAPLQPLSSSLTFLQRSNTSWATSQQPGDAASSRLDHDHKEESSIDSEVGEIDRQRGKVPVDKATMPAWWALIRSAS